MKRTLLSVFFLVLLPCAAAAQTGVVCLFADQNGVTCSLSDNTPGTLTVYAIHTLVPGATGIQFSAPKPACMVGATWLNDDPFFQVTIGDSQTDMAIGYGTCLTGAVRLVAINYATSGTTTADCAYNVLPATGQLDIVATDCTFSTVTAAGGTTFINSNLPCECSGVVPVPPTLAVSPPSLDFGTADSVLTLQISNSGGGILSWQVFSTPFLISVDPQFGTNDGTVTVTVNRLGLPAGVHTGVVNVVSNGGVINVPVSLTVVDPMPALDVSPTSLDFGEFLNSRSFSISAIGTGVLTWNVTHAQPWIALAPASGTGNATVIVLVDRTGLPIGPHSDVIHVTSNGGNADVTVTMTVAAPTPVLGFSPPSLSFPFDTDSLPLSIVNSGTGNLQWSIAGNQPWLTVDPPSGTNDAQVMVRVDRTGLADATFNGGLLITSNGGNGTVPVSMTVSTTPILAVSPTQLVFTTTATQRTFSIQNSGAPTLQWSLSADRSWIEIVPPLTGTGAATVTVNVNLDSVPGGGQQLGNVTVSSNGGTGVVNILFNPQAPGIAGFLGAYGNPQGTDCGITDLTTGLGQVFMVHTNTTGATASQFSAPMPACWTGATYLSDTAVFAVNIGNSQTGIAIAYGACAPSPIHVLTINYFVTGQGPPCCQYNVLPDPNTFSGQIEVVDCSNFVLFAFGSPGFVNATFLCSCATTPVEETTWGRVKAMYYGPGTSRTKKE